MNSSFCPICFEKISKKNCFSSLCNHKYHYHCINRWVKLHNTCPMCRKEIQIKKKHNLIIKNNFDLIQSCIGGMIGLVIGYSLHIFL